MAKLKFVQKAFGDEDPFLANIELDPDLVDALEWVGARSPHEASVFGCLLSFVYRRT